MLSDIKVLLGLSDTTYDSLLNLLIAGAIEFAVDYCNLDEYSNGSFDNLIVQMVLEDYGKFKNSGLDSVSFSGVSESYHDGYSDKVMKQLRKHRKLLTV